MPGDVQSPDWYQKEARRIPYKVPLRLLWVVAALRDNWSRSGKNPVLVRMAVLDKTTRHSSRKKLSEMYYTPF